ncbi:FISUMP domain-containing protein [Chryseobacterium sp. CBSDS_008]|uniref:FISUMP domain-containing protein n=1 Tax=Chryseobacterium sp. CBSDS_008 TaxID=3415265 RepID=UPI003CF12F6C
MRKLYLLPVFMGSLYYGQVGINNVAPKITLDVSSKTTDGSTSEGFMLPRVTGNALKAAETAGVYADAQHSALVFVTAAPDPDNRTGQVEGMDAAGFYYFDAGSNRWVKMISSGTTTAAVLQLLCPGSSNLGTLESGAPVAAVSTTIPYSGGNGGIYSAQTVNSTGVTGLTAVLSSGTLNNGNGTLVYNIMGTPSAAGTATFNIEFAGQPCIFSRTIAPPSSFPDVMPVMINGQPRQMKAHNLGADTSQNPDVPSQAIMGNYFQWGKKDAVATANTPAGDISGWSTAAAANGAWNSNTEATPVKTANDPCPQGFRVPTRNEWVSFNTNSTTTNKGTWATGASDGATNFTAAKVFTNNGSTLTFPTGGYRYNATGGLYLRAFQGYYWSSTENSTNAYILDLGSGSVSSTGSTSRTYGYLVRCISQ